MVPFEVRIVVLGKRLDALEGRLLVLYITDRYNYETLLHQVCLFVILSHDTEEVTDKMYRDISGGVGCYFQN